MAQFSFNHIADTPMIFPETPSWTWKSPSAMSSFAASGSLDSGSEMAELVIAQSVPNEGVAFDNNTYESSHWWSAEYGGRTDKDSNGNVTDWTSMHDPTKGTSVPLSYQKPIWEDDQSNTLPHLRTASDALTIADPIILKANEEWTIAIMCGPQTPSLYGCWLGSTNTTDGTILSSYRWQGRRLRLKSHDGDELALLYSSTINSQYGGGASGLHILRCDGTDVYIRLNGNDLGSNTPSSSSEYKFDRFFHLKTTTTQQNSHGSLHEVVVFDGSFLSGTDLTDLEGVLMSKYDVMDKVPSTHPYYDANSLSYYSTPKVSSSNNATTGSLTLSTSNASFSMKTTNLLANTEYTLYPLDLGNPSDITLKVQWS